MLNESEGDFDLATWDRVFELAELICRGVHGSEIGNDGDVDMADNGGVQSLESFVREVVEEKIRHDHAWKIVET